MRALRLQALADCPEAFGSDYETEAGFGDAEWVARVTPTAHRSMFVSQGDSGSLVGMAGGYSDGRTKTGHTVSLVSVFVRPEARGAGVGAALVAAALAWAQEGGFARMRLCVVTGNTAAIALYVRAGFTVYGVEPDVLRVDGRSYDELLMHRTLARTL